MNQTPPFTPHTPPTRSPQSGARPAGTKTVQVTPVPPADDQIGKICSTCGTAISQGEMIVTCPLCSLPYHHECWKEIGGCGTYGCKAAPSVSKTESVPDDTFTPGWVAEKKCPVCNSSIIATALICKVCRTNFPTERPMTKAEWESREYDGDDLLKIRTRVIGQFALSALGCLFFFSLPANLCAMYTDSWFFTLKRLPPPLKILFYAGLGVSLLWAVLAVFFAAYSMIS